MSQQINLFNPAFQPQKHVLSAAQLALAAGVVDDLLLTVAPLMIAGDGPTVTAGDALDPIVGLELCEVHRAGDHLFLRYAVGR